MHRQNCECLHCNTVTVTVSNPQGIMVERTFNTVKAISKSSTLRAKMNTSYEPRFLGPHGKLWTKFCPSFYGPSAKRAGHENKEGKNEDP